jgi:hypothetical protein
MILNLLDPFLASRVDLVSRNDGNGGEVIHIGDCTISRHITIRWIPILDALTAVTHQLDLMLMTILPSSTDITSKGSSETEPSLRTASKTSELAPDIS